ncbi:Protein of unknown function [Bacillus toyonensis]|jgi:hypothetical protein
MTL